jgi:hypothetical protein
MNNVQKNNTCISVGGLLIYIVIQEANMPFVHIIVKEGQVATNLYIT